MSPYPMASPKKILHPLLLLLSISILAGLLILLERPQGSLAGLVLDEKGKPLTGAQVFVDAYPYKIKGSTDAQGKFQIAQIPTGKYYVRVYKRGFKRA
ncbi:MAG: carboxypeptidase-like regulatory domain-containing protein, partial [bacterium]|nr:carboxypeptidase-like regulatory domain-containing protein [bacterium]